MSSKLEPEEAHWPPEWKRRTPAGRFAEADELGEHVVLILQQMQKGWMTGADVVVDGGEWIWCLLCAICGRQLTGYGL